MAVKNEGHETAMEGVVCVNCGSSDGCVLLEDKQIRQCVEQWTIPLLVEPHDVICKTCFKKAQDSINNRVTSDIGKSCSLCNKVLAPRVRSHQLIALRTDTEHNVNIKNYILEKLKPLKICASQYICHPCWQKSDRAAKKYQPSSSNKKTKNLTKCANCGIDLNRLKRHVLHDEDILVQVQERLAPLLVTSNDYLCNACHKLFANQDIKSDELHDEPMVGHQHICVSCGCSLATNRKHCLQGESNNIIDMVRSWIQPREIKPSDLLCHKCYQRANTNTTSVKVNPVSHQSDKITLPNYSRAPDTHSRCIFQNCTSTSQRMVPTVIRSRLFKDHNYYIPPQCRICDVHLAMQSWSDLVNIENVNRTFTAAYVEEFSELLKNDSRIDFENIEKMDEHLVRYWLGCTKEEFKEILGEFPDYPKRATSLAVYLIKARTGDSDERLSLLLKIGRSTVTKLFGKAREIMSDSNI